MANAGVSKRGWMRPKRAKKMPSRACANGMRAPVRMLPLMAPMMESRTTADSTEAPAGPRLVGAGHNQEAGPGGLRHDGERRRFEARMDAAEAGEEDAIARLRERNARDGIF